LIFFFFKKFWMEKKKKKKKKPNCMQQCPFTPKKLLTKIWEIFFPSVKKN